LSESSGSLIIHINIIVFPGIRRLPKAFVFMNIDAGSENEILKSLREVPEVKESYFVYGVYDVVAKIETETMDRLKEVITWKVRRLDKIRSTLTTIVSEGR
jgi:DNA-binding Lrp family transcriptional regulator